MYRTHTCGELRAKHIGERIILAGWAQHVRKLGAMTFIDLRDRYGVTQLSITQESPAAVRETAASIGREFVVQAKGMVIERASKNPKIPTGDVEIEVEELKILNPCEIPPFTIEENTDGGEELRAQYRYLDLRRSPLQQALMLRHRTAQAARRYLDEHGFMEIETPFLIKSTPEGARDFVVPSRMHGGEFYALPQSPQTFKQLLMVAGYDRYFQIVRCFRDEDLRADRQPEFTQIDCEMSFVEREDIMQIFGGMMQELFKTIVGIEFAQIPTMTYSEAMQKYGCDKPDLRFGMQIHDLTQTMHDSGFAAIDGAEYVGGICAPACSNYSRKQLDELGEWVKRPQIGAKGLIYVKIDGEGIKSSVDKFYSQQRLKAIADAACAKDGDLVLIIAGTKKSALSALCELRLEMGNRLGLRNKNAYAPLWVVDFPLLEWDEESGRFYAMHHPFTSPLPADMAMFMDGAAQKLHGVRANAYDFVVNGVELGGGSIRIFDRAIQRRMFAALGFSEEDAQRKFGFLMDAFRYGAPPHGGIAFGFDRLCAIFGGSDSIRDYIAFPKNNAGRDVMIDAPSSIDDEQLKELNLAVKI
jgi:aspartyl-tRNA synthetase